MINTIRSVGFGSPSRDRRKLAAARTKADRENAIKKLCLSSEGHTVTRVQRDRAAVQLVDTLSTIRVGPLHRKIEAVGRFRAWRARRHVRASLVTLWRESKGKLIDN